MYLVVVSQFVCYFVSVHISQVAHTDSESKLGLGILIFGLDMDRFHSDTNILGS